MMWALYMISSHPEVYKKVNQEIDDVFGKQFCITLFNFRFENFLYQQMLFSDMQEEIFAFNEKFKILKLINIR